ncbi:hypothetical protein DERF_001395 [Dermatophagoides farinae]|uniref:Uncharacterized protein n=1 Tax=Dermatophagoides farinae TaxID=6954 RepID=A0A922I8J3_DERFA|nr:hypothetical protein DERF_001395 [Dermatophagoides farinae]
MLLIFAVVEDRIGYNGITPGNIRAISGTKGSSGFGSHNSEQIESKTFEIVNAGDHCDRNISRHIEPLLFMFG